MTSLLQWLTTPLSGVSEHSVEPNVFWHARLMVLAWGIFLPLGGLVARYFKVTPRQDWPRVLDNKFWWQAHPWFQYTGVLAMASLIATAPLIFTFVAARQIITGLTAGAVKG